MARPVHAPAAGRRLPVTRVQSPSSSRAAACGRTMDVGPGCNARCSNRARQGRWAPGCSTSPAGRRRLRGWRPEGGALSGSRSGAFGASSPWICLLDQAAVRVDLLIDHLDENRTIASFPEVTLHTFGTGRQRAVDRPSAGEGARVKSRVHGSNRAGRAGIFGGRSSRSSRRPAGTGVSGDTTCPGEAAVGWPTITNGSPPSSQAGPPGA
jgi:hypothetical protein